tara:strand:- start:39 stop:203 length:165 start_codon:yes stop_codon:yes gene_type:complete
MFLSEFSNFSELSWLADRKTPIVNTVSMRPKAMMYGREINKNEIKKNKTDLINT